MPTIPGSDLPPPLSWDEFELICRDSFGLRWNTRDFHRHGRLRQAQEGIDIYGTDSRGDLVGIQCKRTTRSIAPEVIDTAIRDAEGFRPEIKRLYIATTLASDAKTQERLRTISDERTRQGKFGVEIVFWGEIVQDLAENLTVARKHFPQYFTDVPSLPTNPHPANGPNVSSVTHTLPQIKLLDQSRNPTQKLLVPYQCACIPNIEALPDFTDTRWPFLRKLRKKSNLGYWREFAKVALISLNSFWFDFEIINDSNTYLTECTAHFTVAAPNGRPVPAHSPIPKAPTPYGKQDQWLKEYAHFIASQRSPKRGWKTRELSTRNLRPGETAGFSDGLLLYFGEHSHLDIQYKILAKELTQPATGGLSVSVNVPFESLTFEELEAFATAKGHDRGPRYVVKSSSPFE